MIKRITLGFIISVFFVNLAFANKYPILIVHGTNDSSQSFEDGCMVTTLRNAGYTVFTLADVGGDFPNKGQGLIQEDVKVLKQAIDEVKRRTIFTHPEGKVDIVAHSRGGIVAEFYTMMYGSQHESTMKYTYHPADSERKDVLVTCTITNIPRYGDDINQIIMIGTPQRGTFWSNFGHDDYRRVQWLRDHGIGADAPDPASVGVEQLQERGSAFMSSFWDKSLNPDVFYINIAEDRFDSGDGVVSYYSAMGVPLHQQRKFAQPVEGWDPVYHTNLYKDIDVKEQVIDNLPRGLLAFNRW